jgi:hypothetical protein
MSGVANESTRTSAKVAGFLLGMVFFFVATLLASFFGIIVLINELDIPGDVAPNVFMIGLIPPAVLTILLYTKVLGRFI